jgi:uncharacterized HhH-GPD family protein
MLAVGDPRRADRGTLTCPRLPHARWCDDHPMADPSILTSLPYTGDVQADALLAREPLALIIGFILDQRVTVPKAFSGGFALAGRMGGRLDATSIAALPTAELELLFRTPPAIHRFPNMMARRVQGMCTVLVRDHGGDAAAIWAGGVDAAQVEGRLCALPGISTFKARSIIGILALRLGMPLTGWEAHVPLEPSMVDVVSPETLRAYQLS